jgi:mannose-6-phosphate isomerase-like protein (cupin superfamily)
MKKSKENAEHYKWGNNCDGWHLLKSESLSVIQEYMPAGTAETLHYHERAQQLFFVLSGEAVIEIEGEVFVLTKNESIHIRNGLRHLIKNISDSELHFLVISEPKSHGDRINCS